MTNKVPAPNAGNWFVVLCQGALDAAVCTTVLGWASGFLPDAMSDPETLLLVAAVAVVITVFSREGLYESGVVLGAKIPVIPLFVAWLAAGGVFGVFAAVLLSRYPQLPLVFAQRSALLKVSLVGLAVIVGTRLVYQAAIRPLFAEHLVADRAIIIGTTPFAQQLIQRIRKNEQAGLQIVGVIDEDETIGRSFCGVPVLSGLDQLLKGIKQGKVQTVIVALPDPCGPAARVLTERLAMMPVNLLAPCASSGAFAGCVVTLVAGLPLLEIRSRPFTKGAALIKRLEDVIVAAIALSCLTPLMLLIALAIKLDTPGPVLFRQKRCGFNNIDFTMLKFRTFRAELADHDASRQTSKGDPRVTRIGAILRRHSLDELPQLLNVLAGSMSLIGPRPHALCTQVEGYHLPDAMLGYDSRLRVKPGITGWAQVHGCRGEIRLVRDITKRVEYDLFYIDNWSLMLDLRILFKTIWSVVHDIHAY